MRINRIYMEEMRVLWAASALLISAGSPVEAAAIGGPLLRDGLEIVPGLLRDVVLDRSPNAIGRSADVVFLVADVHAAKDDAHGFGERAFIPYLSVSYVLTKDEAPTFKKSGLLYPVAAKNGPHYGAPTELSGPGTYHLSYIVSPPSAHGMLRQTDKAGGVPDWWKPINGNWTFTYPQNKN